MPDRLGAGKGKDVTVKTITKKQKHKGHSRDAVFHFSAVAEGPDPGELGGDAEASRQQWGGVVCRLLPRKDAFHPLTSLRRALCCRLVCLFWLWQPKVKTSDAIFILTPTHKKR